MRRLSVRVGLTGRFLLLSGIAMLAMGILAFVVLSHLLRGRAISEAKASAALIARVGVQSHISSSQLEWGISHSSVGLLDQALHAQDVYGSQLLDLTVWNRAGVVVYSPTHRQATAKDYGFSTNTGVDLVGNSARVDALSGHTVVTVEEIERPGGSFDKVLETYVPLSYKGDLIPSGVARVGVPYEPIANAISSEGRDLLLVLGVGLLALYGLLYRIVSRASRQLRDESARNEYLALHDALTDLPNRALLADRVEQAIALSARSHHVGAFFVLDLDHFKEVNDTLGHHAGDRLLRDAATRLRAVLRSSDTVARLGGDEFAVLLPQVNGVAGATLVAEEIRSALAVPVELEGIDVEVEPSIGIVLFPEHGSTADELFQRADVAMYDAKQEKTGFAVYSAQRDQHSPRRLALLSEMRRAIEGGEIVVHYQPIVDIRTGEVIAAEALARWQHPVHGLVPPTEFIPLAERTGLIRELTVYVLEAGLVQLRDWRAQRIDVRLSVNLSARNLLDRTLPQLVADLLQSHGLPADRLQFELTENTIMRDPTRSLAVLSELRELGVSLAVDDFGTGYSSLSYLKHLPVTELKIDRSFVMHLIEDESDARIVQSTIDLSRNMGILVVAEGVEDAATLDRLGSIGCDQAQGYFLSRPVPPEEFAAWHVERSVARESSAA
jgi:diguanylate cyclase (GGDEF)-like protein